MKLVYVAITLSLLCTLHVVLYLYLCSIQRLSVMSHSAPDTGACSNRETSDDSDIPIRQVERRMIRASKAPETAPFESRNWLIHSHYLSKDFDTCRSLILQQLAETQGMCEYAQYVQGMVLRQEGRIQESLEALHIAATLNPQNPENLKQIARSLFLMGKHKTAIEVRISIKHSNCISAILLL